MNGSDQFDSNSESYPTKRPFHGHLLDEAEAFVWLTKHLGPQIVSFNLCSAFLRSEALSMLLKNTKYIKSSRILTRWKLSDLLQGASDLAAYRVATDAGFSFFIKQDFHGKVYSLPGAGILVGSANMTLSGLGIKKNGNSEVCTLALPSEQNINFVNQQFQGAVEMTGALFEEISTAVNEFPVTNGENMKWPEHLINKLKPDLLVLNIMVSECLSSIPKRLDSGLFIIENQQDLSLLGMGNKVNSESALLSAFKELKLHRWLATTLRNKVERELYFGNATALLHEILLDDPAPYRSSVKKILQTLLSWYELFPEIGVMIDKPNYSQRIRLI